MSAIRACRTAALGGHVARCEGCAHTAISYNSCRNRHCPKCQGQTARAWLERRQADLLPVPYYHAVFTLPAPVAAVAFQNKAVVYDLLFRTAADTLLTIAADPKHLGARIGLTAVLHTWGSAMTHHPARARRSCLAAASSPDGTRWVACRPGFFLPVRVLSRLFRRLFLDRLAAPARAGRLAFFGEQAGLADPAALRGPPRAPAEGRVGRLRQASVRRTGGRARLPVALHAPRRDLQQPARLARRARRHVPLEGLSRPGRREGREWIKTMTLGADEFIRRFLLHVLPDGFHRIRHYGLFASGCRAANVARIRTCSRPRHRRRWRIPSRHPRPTRRRLPAPAAEDGSSSSSASAAARPHGRARPRSGSTRHDRRRRHHHDLRPGLRGITEPPRTRSRSRPRSKPSSPIRSNQPVLRRGLYPLPAGGRTIAWRASERPRKPRARAKSP